jgi:hypothetical protein
MELELSHLIDALPGLVWTALPDGRAELINQRWSEYTGLKLEQATGLGWLGAIHPEDLAGLLQGWSTFLESGKAGEVEARLRRHDGEYRRFRFSAAPITDESGQIVRWCGINSDVEDRRRAEEQLREEEQSSRQILDGLPTMVTLMTPAGELDRGNQNMLEYFGKTLEELKARPLGHSFHPDDRDEVVALWRHAIESGETYDHQARLRRADGVYRWFHTRGFPLRNEQGRIITWYLLQADIDERHRAEALLAGEKQLLEKVARGFALPAILDDLARIVEDLAQGYRYEALGPTAFERELIDRFTKIAAIAVERAQADAALKASEADLKRAHAHLTEAQRLSQTGSFTWDVQADEHTWSAEIYRIFGIAPGTRVTMPMIHAVIYPEDLPAVGAVIGRALVGEDFDLVFRIVPADGAIKHAHVVGRRNEQITDRFVFLGAIHDVTQSKAVEEALNKARSELAHVTRVMTLGALTASIAHEVNQPLSGIITNASTCLRMLAADPPNIEGARAVTQRTLRDGNRASEVVQRLRSLFIRKQPKIEQVDLNDAAREVLTLSLSELQSSRVLLRNEFAADLPAVRGDRVQLQQVILNLVLNAADAMREVEDRPRHLLIATAREDAAAIRLSVRDCGVGIDPNAIEKLFDAFYTTKSSGMGIGLAISRSIIESHAGRLWAAVNQGPGATFSFSIPCRPVS